MNKKTVLIGLSVSALMTATLAVAIGNKDNIKAFAEDVAPGNYTAVIDSNNRLKTTNFDQRYAFQLHNGSEYGYFTGRTDWLNINPTGVYSDYAFSWRRPANQSDNFFMIQLVTNDKSYIVEGKSCLLRGFPGAYRITTVYSESSDNLDFDVCPTYGWTTKSLSKSGDLITAVAEKNVGATKYSSNMDWCLREEGTIYIKSITIEYYC